MGIPSGTRWARVSECHSAAFARALPEPQREESLRGYTCCRTPTKREREIESLRGYTCCRTPTKREREFKSLRR